MQNPFAKLWSRIVGKSNSQGWQNITGGSTPGTLMGKQDDPTALMQAFDGWVFVSVNKIGMAMAGLRIKLMKSVDGEDVEVFDHPILDVLTRPNSYMTGRDLVYNIATHQELTGNSYLLQDKPMNPMTLFPLNPALVSVQVAKMGTDIEGYKFQNGAYSRTMKREEIVHLKYPNPFSPFKGIGPLSRIAAWVDVDDAATEFNRRFFLNGATLAGNLETDATDESALKLAKVGFEMIHKGVENAHKVGVLPKGTKFVPSSASPKDMEFSTLDIRFRDKILSGFGVPKSVLGISESGDSKSDAEAGHYAFMLFTVKPKMDLLIHYLNEHLLPKYAGTDNLYLDYENPIPADVELDIKKWQAALGNQAYQTINEVRSEQGLPAVDGGDEIMVPFSSMPLGMGDNSGGSVDNAPKQFRSLKVSSTKQKKSMAPFKRSMIVRKAKAEKLEGLTNDIASTLAMTVGIKLAEIAGSGKEEDPAEVEHKAFITRTTVYEKKTIKSFISHDETLRKEAVGNLEEAIKSFGTKGVAKKLIDRNNAIKAVFSFMDPIMQKLIDQEGTAQMEKLDTQESFDPKNAAMQKRVRELMDLTGESYTDTTIKLLDKHLQKGIDKGESLPNLTKRVNDVFDFTEKFRAERVARSVVFGVANTAARGAYKQSGVVSTVKWHTAEDELVCEFCGPMQGKVIDVDGEFFGKGDTVRGSGGGKLDLDFMDVEDPPLHANCRCFTLPDKISIENSAPEMDDEMEFLAKGIAILEQHAKPTQKTT